MPNSKIPIVSTRKRGARSLAHHREQHRTLPLQWWRADHTPHLDAATVAELRTVLSRLHLLAHPTWPEAVAGDAAAVVRIAMTIRYDVTSPTWLIDCAGSLALLCAAEGSDTATAILRHLRQRYIVPARCRAHRST